MIEIMMICSLLICSLLIILLAIIAISYQIGIAVERQRQDIIRREAVAAARLAHMMQLMDVGSSKDLLEVIDKCKKFVDLVETNPDKLSKLESFILPK